MTTLAELFDTFSTNLGFYRRNRSGLFRCPLCLHTFSRVQMDNRELSRAHTIPKSLGGTHWALACTQCNNTVGSEIESCAIYNDRRGRVLSGNTEETMRTRAWLENKEGERIGPVQADLGAQQSQGELKPHALAKEKGSHPQAWDLFVGIEAGEVPADQWKTTVELPAEKDSKRANLAYVHAAYMHMFHQFGYEWILTPGAQKIREQIVSPDQPIIVPLAPALSGPGLREHGLTLLLVTEPADFRSFVAVLPELGWPRRRGIWLPMFDGTYRQPPQRKGVHLTVVPVPDHHQFLHMPESQFQGYRFVQDHLGGRT